MVSEPELFMRFEVVENITEAREIMERVQRHVLTASFRMGALLENRHRSSVSTWNGPPTFKSEASGNVSAESVNIFVMVSGGELEVKKWFWVDKGTKVRYAQLSSDWQSKTFPGRRVPGEGRGKVVAINKRFPHDGIQPRDFTEMHVDDNLAVIATAWRGAVADGLNNVPLFLR